jgi:XTP/dITP diphosphohydrolase
MPSATTLVLATRNRHKVKEIRELIKGHPLSVAGLEDFGPIPEVEEDGETFEENAYKKASFTSRVLGLPAMADDSGLMVEALGGRPGVRSARYGGPRISDGERCRKLLEALEGETDRRAAFACVLSLAVPTGQALTYEGRCEGIIARKPAGSNGFGYDPIFYYPPLQCTFAQLSRKEKSRVSHRGLALRELRDELGNVLQWIALHMPANRPNPH